MALAIEAGAKKNDRCPKGKGKGRKGEKGGKPSRVFDSSRDTNDEDSRTQDNCRPYYDRNRDDNRNTEANTQRNDNTQSNDNNAQRQRSRTPDRRYNNYGPQNGGNRRRQQQQRRLKSLYTNPLLITLASPLGRGRIESCFKEPKLNRKSPPIYEVPIQI